MLTLINLVPRAEPFDHHDWVFEAKFDGFRAAADTVRGQTDLAQLQPDASASRRRA
jgi:ATP-dependent DNA ligase